MASSLEAVVGYDVAHELIIARISAVGRAVGTPEAEGWKRSACAVSTMECQQDSKSTQLYWRTQFEETMCCWRPS